MNEILESARSRHEPGWARSYPLWSAVLRAQSLRVGAEVGVAFGGHSEAMLRNAALVRLYSVDRYRHDPRYEDAMNFSQELFDDLYTFVVDRLAPFGDRSELVRAESADAAAMIPDGLDFVYIDADHSYSGVQRDMQVWSGKVRDGGIIGGHDYGHPDFPGVREAIDGFVGRFGGAIHEEGEGVWWTRKERLRVSFIVPAYNCEATIDETIGSIQAGNLQDDDEVVIVDDCSTDGTPGILQRLQQQHPFIRVVTHRHNRGTASGARNTAMDVAAHDVFFCLDSDNLLTPHSIPELSRLLYSSGADVAAFGEIHYFRGRPDQVTHTWVFPEQVTLADALSGMVWPGPSGNYMLTRESWLRAGRYPEPFLENRSLETWVFAVRQLGTGSRLVALPRSWYLHRYGHESHYVRNWQRGSQSLTALMGLMPLLDLLVDEDVDYIFSKESRSNWLERLRERPLRVKQAQPGSTGEIRTLRRPLSWRILESAAAMLEKGAKRLRSWAT